MKIVVITAAVSLLACAPALAENGWGGNRVVWDGNKMLTDCQQGLIPIEELRQDHLIGAMGCMGFVHGSFNGSIEAMVAQHRSSIQAGEVPPRILFCWPKEGVVNIQLARIFVKYLREHPEKLHSAATDLALEAWVDAFPCPDPPSKEEGSP